MSNEGETREYLPLQLWSCEKCQGCGDVGVEPGADVWTVYTQITDAHRTASPLCHKQHGVKFVRAHCGVGR